MEKIHKKLRPYMRGKGLMRKGRVYFKIIGDIAYCIGFEFPGHNVHAYFFIVPMYMRYDSMHITYGERINTLFHEKMPVLKKTGTDDEIGTWIETVTGILDTHVLPFFDRIDTPEKLLNFLFDNWEQRKKYIFCPPLETIRLQMYTLLYLHRTHEAKEAIESFRAELGQSTYLMDWIIKKCHEEANQLEGMLTMSDEEVDAFFAESIEFTKVMCFS
jgi:hypothetical protein